MKLSSSPYTRQPVRPSNGILQYPDGETKVARNNRPVVLLHGTIVEKEGIEKFREYALSQGHPVNHRTYSSITDGGAIEQSAETASQEVNLSRAEVAKQNLAAVKDAETPELLEFFQMSPDLYGPRDPDVEKIEPHLKPLVETVASTLEKPEKELRSRLGRDLRKVESELAESLQQSGLTEKKAKGVAEELLDTLAPKALVVGHSAGGFVAQTMLLNPEVGEQESPFSYDGGNGIGQVVLLSSPVGKGLPKPAPDGILETPYYNYERNVLRPLENTPAFALARLNPAANLAYTSSKALLKMSFRMGSMVGTSMTSPLIHLAQPGYAQVEEGHEFFNHYLSDKKIPVGTSVLSVTSPLDRLVEEERATLPEELKNGHNFSFDLEVTENQVKTERPTWTHVMMTEQPNELMTQYGEELTEDTSALVKLLDEDNDEGARWQALTILQKKMEQDPGHLDSNSELTRALQNVAAEQLPFTDSPSYLAHRLLQS